jgi:hypothetical protein
MSGDGGGLAVPVNKQRRTSIWDVRRPHHVSNLFHGLQVGTESAVHREDLAIDYGSNGKAVEAVREHLPELDIVTALACIFRDGRQPNPHLVSVRRWTSGTNKKDIHSS